MRLGFKLEAVATGSHARAGTFKTLHNEVKTPLFMPVGTRATVKAQDFDTLEAAGSQILLANTYHLLLRPGPEVFKRMGGIHGLTTWKKSFLTDSGGYQIFSLPHSRQMTEEGALFQSYVDGKSILLSPELSIETQKAIGSDIMMVLDQCIPSTADQKAARDALGITHRWAARSLAARGESPQSAFAIVQGALFHDLRRESVEHLSQMPFDGFAIGGLAVGESKTEREDTCEFTTSLMPKDRPRYLMGVGTPLDLLEAVHRGVDMFDCILPTQLAQRGGVFTSRGFLQLRRGVYKYADEKLDPACDCPTCSRYSRAYLHHLTKCKEMFGWTLLGQHNIYFYHQLMREIRQSILEDRFMELYREKRAFLQEEDFDNPVNEPKRKPTKSRAPALVLGAYEVHLTSSPEGDSHASIRHTASGEIMHSKDPPMVEANRLYIEQSELAVKLNEVTDQPLVIWDIGLGAAANAMAAVRCYEELAEGAREEGRPIRPMKIISFENDLDSLKLAFAHSNQFDYLRHSGPAGILKGGRWESKQFEGLSWELVEGDFRETYVRASSAPDLIFYDFFSNKTNVDHWSIEVFEKLFKTYGSKAAELFTYSSSTAVRVALLAAGFYVAKGRGTGEKAETTIALTPVARKEMRESRFELLASDWLQRWNRSGAKFPLDISQADHSRFEQIILGHVQFAAR